MKRIFKISLIFFFSALILIYSSLAGYLWWSERQVPKYSQSDSFEINSLSPHEVILINNGLESLKRRILAIENAKKTIELEYFIYELDLAAQIISMKLIEAANRGVDIRVLVDSSAAVFKLKPEYAKFLSENNIKVKYYNTAPLRSIINVQHRSHRKFLIADSERLITGGRNIANDYFDLSDHYNFLDSDVEITGPIVKEVQRSFESYWNSKYSSLPEDFQGETNLSFVNEEKIEETISLVRNKKFNSKVFICNDIDFVTDSPGVDFKNRKIWPYLLRKLSSTKESLIAESPYFVLRPDGLKLIESLSKKGIEQIYLTNSLFSTDAYYTVSTLLPNLNDLRKFNANIYLYNGLALKRDLSINSRWGLHAKRAVLDKKHTLIGTYNIDPRSANLNSEVILSCNNNKEIAMATLESMKERRKNSWKLFQENKTAISNLTKNASFEQKLKFYLVLPLARLFNFLL